MKKKSQANASSANTNLEPYLVIIRDLASDGYWSEIVLEDSPESAMDEAVKEQNIKQDFKPEEDGGFRAVLVYDREDLNWLLPEMNQA